MASTTSAAGGYPTTAAYQGYVDPNWPPPGDEGSARIIIYGYVPSMIVCGLALGLFSLAFIVHLLLLLKYRTWYFSTVVVATFMEILGYIFRTLSAVKNPYAVSYFVAQYFLIVVAPVLYSAAIYTIVSVLINAYGRQYAPFRPKLVLWGFVTCDIVATIIQVVGAGLIGSAYSNQQDPTTPNNILLAGLAFQVFTFAVFLVIFSLTIWKGRASPVKVSTPFIVSTVIATLAVYLRTCFRLAETAEGLQATISTHEVYFGCLEFAPIVVAVYLFMYWHPGRYLQGTIVRKASTDVEGR